jgi:hypothetical protein
MVNCSICDEPYGEDRPPLLLACCKGCHLCEECLESHLKVSHKCPMLCSTRPSVRNFVSQCRKVTPAIDVFLKTLEERDSAKYDPRPRAVQLGEAGLFDVYVNSREMDGDADVALQLQLRYEQEAEEEQARKIKRDEEGDLAFARHLQEREERETAALKKRLTKAPTDINGIVNAPYSSSGSNGNKGGVKKGGTVLLHSQRGGSSGKVRTLDSFFGKAPPAAKPSPPSSFSQSSSSSSSSSSSQPQMQHTGTSLSSSPHPRKKQRVEVINLTSTPLG